MENNVYIASHNGIAGIIDVNVENASLAAESPVNAVTAIQTIAVPVIAVLGIIGNCVSFAVFTRPSLRTNSCSFFLAARSVSDSGFLIALFTIWLSSTLDLELSRITGLCQTFIFLTYVFSCMSVWLVVFVTAENYIRICKPFLVNKVCKLFNAKVLVAVVCVLVSSFYSFPFWAVSGECIPVERQFNFMQGVIYVDSLLTFVIPCILMTVFIVSVLITTLKSCKRRRRLSASSMKASKNPVTKVAKMLLAVTLIFFCLNIPSHVVRLRLAIQTFKYSTANVTSLDVTINSLALLLYYTSLAINVIVYYIFGSKFRHVFQEIVLCKKPALLSVTSSRSATSFYSAARVRRQGLPAANRRMMSESLIRIDKIPQRKISSFF